MYTSDTKCRVCRFLCCYFIPEEFKALPWCGCHIYKSDWLARWLEQSANWQIKADH